MCSDNLKFLLLDGANVCYGAYLFVGVSVCVEQYTSGFKTVVLYNYSFTEGRTEIV